MDGWGMPDVTTHAATRGVLDHHAVTDDHRDATVPHRRITGTQETGIDRGAHGLVLGQPPECQVPLRDMPRGYMSANTTVAPSRPLGVEDEGPDVWTPA